MRTDCTQTPSIMVEVGNPNVQPAEVVHLNRRQILKIGWLLGISALYAGKMDEVLGATCPEKPAPKEISEEAWNDGNLFANIYAQKGNINEFFDLKLTDNATVGFPDGTVLPWRKAFKIFSEQPEKYELRRSPEQRKIVMIYEKKGGGYEKHEFDGGIVKLKFDRWVDVEKKECEPHYKIEYFEVSQAPSKEEQFKRRVRFEPGE